jgi:general secretion pathway protein G
VLEEAGYGRQKVPSPNDSTSASSIVRWHIRAGALSGLLALVSPRVDATSSQVIKAEVGAQGLATATESFTRDLGRLPRGEEWPSGLLTRPQGVETWRGPYIKRVSKDPWGSTYRFHSCASPGAGCRIYSVGKNEVDERGAGDDVSSWKGYDEDVYFPNATRNAILTLLAMFCILFGGVYGLVRASRFLWRRWHA